MEEKFISKEKDSKLFNSNPKQPRKCLRGCSACLSILPGTVFAKIRVLENLADFGAGIHQRKAQQILALDGLSVIGDVTSQQMIFVVLNNDHIVFRGKCDLNQLLVLRNLIVEAKRQQTGKNPLPFVIGVEVDLLLQLVPAFGLVIYDVNQPVQFLLVKEKSLASEYVIENGVEPIVHFFCRGIKRHTRPARCKGARCLICKRKRQF